MSELQTLNKNSNQVSLSRGSSLIKWPVLKLYVDALPKDSSIVSVGSNGSLEQLIQAQCGRTVISMGPCKTRKSDFTPEFEDANDLVRRRSELVSNCCLLLDWTEADSRFYDFAAIALLKPRFVFSICETYQGLSGSRLFYRWREAIEEFALGKYTDGIPPCRLPTFEEMERVVKRISTVWINKISKEELNYLKEGPLPEVYSIISRTRRLGQDDCGPVLVESILFQRWDQETPKGIKDIPSVIPDYFDISFLHGSCVVV